MPAPPAALDLRRWRRLEQQMLDDPIDALTAPVGVSSRGRPWTGLAVWLQRGPVEDLYIPPVRQHCIVVRRAAAPVRLLQRHGATTAECDWQPGEVIVVPAGMPSFWRSSAERDNLHVDLDPLWLARAAGDEGAAPPPLRSGFGSDDAVLRGFAQLLLASLDSNASLRPGFADALALALAAHLLEHHAQATAGAPRRTGALTQRQLAAVADAVQPEPGADWSLERLAALLGLSPFHFARAFKAACGETPHRWLTRLRLERARREVLTTEAPLIEIAVDNGFASLSHFGQAFRRRWGTSPGRLRLE